MAWVVAAVLVVVALFTLGSADTPKLNPEPPSFDGEAAYADLLTIVEDFPQRVAGSDPDNRMGIWVEQQFRAMGLETHIDSFAATVNGKDVALQNVWAISKGRTQGTIMVLANRDVPPLATQGAGDNASGVAAMLALAEAFTVTAHEHSIIFLCTTGDAFGALGANEFVQIHQTDDLYAVLALRDVAKRDSRRHRPRRLERGAQDGSAVALAALRSRRQARLQHGGHAADRGGAGAASRRPHRRRQPGAVRRQRACPPSRCPPPAPPPPRATTPSTRCPRRR